MIVTGRGDLQTAVEAMTLGAADFMTKPFETDALVKKIESLVAQAVPDIDEDGERRRADGVQPDGHRHRDGALALPGQVPSRRGGDGREVRVRLLRRRR